MNDFQNRFQYHFYGRQSALTVEQDCTVHGFHTLSFDVAKKLTGKNFDWNNKIRVQLGRNELPRFIAVTQGWLREASFSYHGQQNNKSLKICNQPTGLYIQNCQAGDCSGVPIGVDDAVIISALALEVFSMNFPHVDSHSLLKLVHSQVSKSALMQST